MASSTTLACAEGDAHFPLGSGFSVSRPATRMSNGCDNELCDIDSTPLHLSLASASIAKIGPYSTWQSRFVHRGLALKTLPPIRHNH